MKHNRVIRNVRLGVKSLLLHKLRSMLTMLGVVFGVGSVVAMLSVGEGASREALQQISKLGSNNIIITSMKPQEEEDASAGRQRSRLLTYGLLFDDEHRIRESFPHVNRVVPAKLIRKEARLGQQTTNVRVVGTTPDWFELVQRPLLAGRVLTWNDLRTNAGVCVLAEQTARALLATRHTIGQQVSIAGEWYYVVGIVQNEGESEGGVQTPDEPIDAYIPIPVVRQRIGDMVIQRSSGSFSMEKVDLHQLIVQVGDPTDRKSIEYVEPTSAGIEAMLKRFHKAKDYEISVPLALLNQARETQRIFNIVLGSIAGISLLVGGIGIMNIMLASVTERTREIGVRRAIGARRRQIIVQFLIETIVLSVTGGIIGVLMGLVIPALIERFADMPTVVTLDSVLLSVGISAMVGIIFGLYPAYRAAMLDPIVALRHE